MGDPFQLRPPNHAQFRIDIPIIFGIWYLVILPMSFATIITKSFLPKIILLVVLAYLGICLLLFFAQRKLIYLPSRANHPLPVGFEPWLITSSSGATEFSGFKRVAQTSPSTNCPIRLRFTLMQYHPLTAQIIGCAMKVHSGWVLGS